MDKRLFKFHRLDSILVLIAMAEIALLVLPFTLTLSFPMIIFLFLFNIFLVGTNYQCVAHNFIHHPFFQSSFLNSIFSILNTLCLGIPQSLYRIHHFHHHRFNNHPEKDESSTYRYGKNNKEENILLYATLGMFRTDLVSLYKMAAKKSRLVHIELIFLALFLMILAYVNWQLLIGYVVMTYLFGQIFALWENYCEHHFADFNDKKRDSVSCYNSFYNLIWFNNGYHQEHHFSPQVHWTKIPLVKENLPKDRVIVKYCHLIHSFKK